VSLNNHPKGVTSKYNYLTPTRTSTLMAAKAPPIPEHRYNALVAAAHTFMQVATTLKFTSLFQFGNRLDA
jgi:hypothetical protein